jgi:hypothetical protein
MRRLLSVALLVSIMGSLLAEEPKPADPDKLVLKRPADIDDATWARLKAEHAARIQKYLEILATAEAERPRPDRDGIAEYMEKQANLEGILFGQARKTVEDLTYSDDLVLSNYVFLWSEVSPRLSGAVRKVGKGDKDPSLIEALSKTKNGDLILLEDGEYQLGHGEWSDIAIVGRGPSRTTLKCQRGGVNSCRRVRVEGLKIDCQDDPFCDIRDKGALHLKDCYVFNYNSGAGGSDSMFAVGSLILIEGCTFEGLTRRAGKDGDRGGVAFDFRGSNILYARKTTFINNSEILRAGFPCTFDECRSSDTIGNTHGIMCYGGPIWLRKNAAQIDDRRGIRNFEYAVDDRAFVEYVLGERKELNVRSKRLAEESQLVRHLPYWIRLLGHPDIVVRTKASAHFEKLTGQKIERPKPELKVTPEEVDRLLKELDSNVFKTREAAKKQLEEAGEGVREKLDVIVATGGLEQSRRAQEVLVRLDAKIDRHLLARDEEFCRGMKWYEENKDRLRWDEKARRYVLQK